MASRAACSSSTSTASARSTTPTDATSATPCCELSPSGCATRCATRTPSPGWTATRSASCPAGETDVVTAAAVAWNLRAAFEQPVPCRRSRDRRQRELRDRLLPPARAHDRRPAAPRRRWPSSRPRPPAAACGSSAPSRRIAPSCRFALLSELRERHPARRARPALPAQGRTAPADAGRRRRSARALAAPDPRPAQARPVHPRRRRQPADRAHSPNGSSRRHCASRATGGRRGST